MVSSFFFVVFSKQNVIKHQPSSSSQYNWMITLNDPKFFTRSKKSRRKRAQHEREGSKNVKKEGAFVDPIRGALFPRGRERRACVCVLFFFRSKSVPQSNEKHSAGFKFETQRLKKKGDHNNTTKKKRTSRDRRRRVAQKPPRWWWCWRTSF